MTTKRIRKKTPHKRIVPKEIPEGMGEHIAGVLGIYVAAMQIIGQDHRDIQETYMIRMENSSISVERRQRIAEALAGIHYSMHPNSRK